MKPVSSIERLRSLPELFRGADLTTRFRWSSKTASQYLYRWKLRGLVDALGGHSDLYANLLVSRYPNWERALVAAMPSALLIGIEALRQTGWTTQIPQRPTVAVDASQPVYTTPRFDLAPRAPQWFERVRPGIVGSAREGLPRLSPAWALADLLNTEGWGACGLWPDDIDLADATREDQAQWQAARSSFQLQQPQDLLALAEPGRSHEGS